MDCAGCLVAHDQRVGFVDPLIADATVGPEMDLGSLSSN